MKNDRIMKPKMSPRRRYSSVSELWRIVANILRNKNLLYTEKCKLVSVWHALEKLRKETAYLASIYTRRDFQGLPYEY